MLHCRRTGGKSVASLAPILLRGSRRRYTQPQVWAPQGEGLWPHLTVREHLAVMGGHETEALLAET